MSVPSFGLRAAPPALSPSQAKPIHAGPPVAAGAERRGHARVPLALRGRYMLEDGREYPCATRDVSRLGIAIEGVPVGAIGERVIAYLDQLGRIEGRVVRRSEDWFAIALVATPQKLDRLDEKISAIMRRTREGA